MQSTPKHARAGQKKLSVENTPGERLKTSRAGKRLSLEKGTAASFMISAA